MLILEYDDYPKYFEYVEEYSPYAIFHMVMNNENLWLPLINPNMYKQALSEFTKYGYLDKFPKKYIYQWIGILMKNTAILRSTTEIAGHTQDSPFEEFYDYFFNDEGVDKNGQSWENFLQKNNLNEDDEYEAMTQYLDEIGFYDNLVLPDGSDAWSDYGLEPLEKLLLTYNDKMSAEDCLVLINKVLDVYHQRGDLSSAFIEGGTKSLSQISYNESIIKNKKIYISENQIKALITERISSNVYHFTSIRNALKIAEEDAIFLQTSLDGFANDNNSNKLSYFSTTRTKYQSFGYSRKFDNNSARIELDGDKLNYDYSAKPYNYWGDSMGKPTYLKNDEKGMTVDKQEHVRDEAEDRIITNKSVIEPAHKYIKRIDIILTNIDDHSDVNYLDTTHLLLSRYHNFVYVYDNLQDFNKQSSNTINKKILDQLDTFNIGSYDNNNIKLNGDMVQVVLAAILNGESEDLVNDSAKLLKKYGLNRYLTGNILKKNKYFDYPYNINLNNLVDILTYKLSDASRKPNREKSRIIQMITDYFNRNNLKNYSDYIKHKSFKMELNPSYQYSIIDDYVKKGYIDPNKKIEVLIIRNTSTYDNIIVTDVNSLKVSDVNKDLMNVAEFFINATEENMKSKNYKSYRKYIISVFKQNPTVGKIINMLNQLGYEENIYEKLQFILDTLVKYKTIDVYSFNSNMIMQQSISNPKNNLTKFLNLFKK